MTAPCPWWNVGKQTWRGNGFQHFLRLLEVDTAATKPASRYLEVDAEKSTGSWYSKTSSRLLEVDAALLVEIVSRCEVEMTARELHELTSWRPTLTWLSQAHPAVIRDSQSGRDSPLEWVRVWVKAGLLQLFWLLLGNLAIGRISSYNIYRKRNLPIGRTASNRKIFLACLPVGRNNWYNGLLYPLSYSRVLNYSTVTTTNKNNKQRQQQSTTYNEQRPTTKTTICQRNQRTTNNNKHDNNDNEQWTKAFRSLYKPVQSCTNLYKAMGHCTTLYNVSLFCTMTSAIVANTLPVRYLKWPPPQGSLFE